VDLVVELEAGAAATVTARAAALDHEVLDDPVEGQAVVEGLGLLLARGRVLPFLRPLGEADEVRHRLRGVVLEQFQADVAVVGVQGGVHVDHPSTTPRGRLVAECPQVRSDGGW
jgi:hypothetical protein